MLNVVTDDGATQSGSLVDEIVREAAPRMLAAALEAEVNQCTAEMSLHDAGRRRSRPGTSASAVGRS